MPYDVFISYRGVNLAWVEVLARNLGKCDLKVCLDKWSFIPGDTKNSAVSNGIKNSRSVVLVVTPDLEKSVWCTDHEYGCCCRRLERGDDFRLIPIHVGSTSDVEIPFLDNRIDIDFSDPTEKAYRYSFYRLLMALQDKPPGSDPQAIPGLIIPDPIHAKQEETPDTPLAATEQRVLTEVFKSVNKTSAVVLLAQDGWDRSRIHRAILAKARFNFEEEQVLHLVAPLNARTCEEYFAEIANKLGGKALGSSSCSWESHLRNKINGKKIFFLLVTRIEEGIDEGRRELAQSLRGLCEEIDNFKVVLCGAERLAELCFADGEYSLLNAAEEVWWHDPTSADVYTWQHELSSTDDSISEIEVQDLLTLCGSHPRLLHQALRLRHNGSNLTQIRQTLADSILLTAPFIYYRSRPAEAKRIAKWLQNEKVADYDPWPEDPVLRRLFWKSLLVKRDGYFQWRCPLVREVGSRILKGCLA